jgi:hypothetical protein
MAFILALFALAPTVARGQAISVEYDLNTPAYTEPENPGGTEFDVEQGFSMRAGFMSQNYATSKARHRWSFFVGHQSLETTPHVTNPNTTKHSANSLEVGHDWLVFERSRVCLSLGVSAGLVLINHADGYANSGDSFSIELPDGGWQLSGFGRCEFPVSSKFGLMVGIRGWLLTRDREDMFPFESGPVVSVGIQLS